ncbi:MAG: hypothetical protein ACTSRG_13525 [Candidatus Helarchaeota archaeon]
MPEEFSIAIDEEKDAHPSIIVKLTFYDLIQTWPKLLAADKVIIYHDIEIDRAGIELEGVSHKFWGIKNDPTLDYIKIARAYFSWIQNQMGNKSKTNDSIYSFYSKFYRKEGIVDFDENNPLQKILYDRLLAEKRQKLERRKKYTCKLSPKMTKILDQQFKNEAIMKWDKLLKDGKLIYYPPKTKLIL